MEPELPTYVSKRLVAPPAENFPDAFWPLLIHLKWGFSGTLPDRINFRKDDLVSLRCKEAIEDIDPEGGHQFVPAEIRDAKGEIDIPRYFWFVAGRVYTGRLPKDFEPIPDKRSKVGYRFRRVLVAQDNAAFCDGIPIWSDASGKARMDHCSGDVIDALRSRGLTGFEQFHEEQLHRRDRKGEIPGSAYELKF